MLFDAEQANLSGAGWNNQAESLSIRQGDIWEVCAETDFKDCRRIDSNVPDLGKVGLNKKISSIRPIYQIDPTFVITHRLPLGDAPAAFDLFSEKQDECLKVVLKTAA